MSNKKKQENRPLLFKKKNYILMLIGLAFITTGFILMSGGGSKDPEVFNEAIYNARRIKVAPTLVIIGFAIEIYAIMAKPK